MLDMTGVILAGGKSTRMGTDKAFMHIGQVTMIKKIASELGKVFSRILIVSNNPNPFKKHLGLPVVEDLRLGCGPLGGIHAGLFHAATPYVFITACDMPFIDARLIRILAGACTGYDAVVPKIGEYLEPLFAVYGKSCLSTLEKALDSGYYKVVEFIAFLHVNYIDEARLKCVSNLKRVFMNINTPRDLYRANQLEKIPL